jgi:outer membrane protein assembly factor BamE (lipoprotein component of BamABCDE complex)
MRLPSSLLVLFLLTTCVAACSIGLAPARVVAGKEFFPEEVELIQEGMTSNQVQEILGRPLRITPKGEAETWQYFFRLRQDDIIKVLGFIPIRRPVLIWEREAEILIRSDKVEKVDLTDHRIK